MNSLKFKMVFIKVTRFNDQIYSLTIFMLLASTHQEQSRLSLDIKPSQQKHHYLSNFIENSLIVDWHQPIVQLLLTSEHWQRNWLIYYTINTGQYISWLLLWPLAIIRFWSIESYLAFTWYLSIFLGTISEIIKEKAWSK